MSCSSSTGTTPDARRTRGFDKYRAPDENRKLTDPCNIDMLGRSDGAKIEKGATVQIRDRQTRVRRYAELGEDFEYAVA
ncbi:hypothetical protein AB5J52_30595 [Streptomyces sp. R39]|uniref:Uncharacterized protein n=1 Tax=Streptomyces sp. R39 TaxID=3238631 RepID=A0AB39R7Z7_9ACTN